MDIFQIDTTLQLTGNFIDSASGTLVDPTAITLFLQAPNAAASQFTYPSAVTKLAVGQYSYVFTASVSGTWTYKWQGTGAVVATSPDQSFTVAASVMIPG